MPDWALAEPGFYEQAYTVSGSSPQTITAGGTVNTKGAWAQLVAATAHPADMIVVTFGEPSAAGTFLLDIGIGGAGSEQVIIPNLLLSDIASTRGSQVVAFPMFIPAGSRIAARLQASVISLTCKVSVQLMTGGWNMDPGISGVVDLGTATGTSRGTQLDPGGTANTKSAWTQIVASTSGPIGGIAIAYGSAAQTTQSSGNYLIDIGVGGAGAEQTLISNLLRAVTSAAQIFTPHLAFIPLFIPSGSRVAARVQSDIIAANRVFDIALYGALM